MSLMVMAVERAITLFFPHRQIFDRWWTLAFVAVLWTISICFAVPVLTDSIPVKPFKYRYICDVDRLLLINIIHVDLKLVVPLKLI